MLNPLTSIKVSMKMVKINFITNDGRVEETIMPRHSVQGFIEQMGLDRVWEVDSFD